MVELLGLVALAGQLVSTMSTRVTVKSVVLALLLEPVAPVPEPLTSEPVEVELPPGLAVPLCAVLEDPAVFDDAAEAVPVFELGDELGFVVEALPVTPPPVVLPLALMPAPEAGVPWRRT